MGAFLGFFFLHITIKHIKKIIFRKKVYAFWFSFWSWLSFNQRWKFLILWKSTERKILYIYLEINDINNDDIKILCTNMNWNCGIHVYETMCWIVRPFLQQQNK